MFRVLYCRRENPRRPVSASTQIAESPEPRGATTKSVRLWIIAGCLIGLLGAWWWERSGRSLIVRTVHPYRVTHINSSDATIDLMHGNRSYVVRCSEHCGQFTVGGFYPMEDAGAVLRYTHAGQTISLPIVEEQTDFDVTGGRG